MTTSLLICLALVLSLLLSSATLVGAWDAEMDPERVARVAAMLPEAPTGLGRPISDREAWDALAATEAYQRVLDGAERLLTEPLPEQPDDLYLDFSRTGNRTRWQKVASQRRGRVAPLVLAECAENQGRFVEAFEQVVEALCAERTWVMPAHDGKLTNFNGEVVDIDLASSALGWELTTARYILGDRLSPAIRDLIRDNVTRRVLAPYRDMFTGAREPNWWTRTTNNWNAVCLAGVTGAGLAQLESGEERAEFIVAAEGYSRNFLAGFTPDGYCSEGLGYWNYGFGHYVLLAEALRQATSGGVDLMARPEVRAPATFGARIQIVGGVSPAFADCSVLARPDRLTMYYLNRLFSLGLRDHQELNLHNPPGSLATAMIFSFPNSASQTPPAPESTAGPGLRDWFQDAGVLIGRPAPASECRLAVALKGGHNAEHHNHNDVGSYVVVIGQRAVLLDPGSETYTARTFSGRRYESKLLNSYGHPVPVVAGQLQRTGKDARADVLHTEFTDAADTLQLDLKAAYDVPDLQVLERTFVYSRQGTGSLTVSDRVEFGGPQTFETALITQGEWLRMEDGALAIYNSDQAVRVEVDGHGSEVAIEADEIHEEAPVQPVRLGIKLVEPASSATITVRIAPLAVLEEGRPGGLLPNGGFELGSWGWSLPEGGVVSSRQEGPAA